MPQDQEIVQLLSKLNLYPSIKFDFEGSDVQIKAVDNSSKLSLSTPVYVGNNYIPPGVRESINQEAPFVSSFLPTYLTIDEKKFSVSLNYLGNLEDVNFITLRNLLEEFVTIAEEWRLYLDDQDHNDRVYIYQKR